MGRSPVAASTASTCVRFASRFMRSTQRMTLSRRAFQPGAMPRSGVRPMAAPGGSQRAARLALRSDGYNGWDGARRAGRCRGEIDGMNPGGLRPAPARRRLAGDRRPGEKGIETHRGQCRFLALLALGAAALALGIGIGAAIRQSGGLADGIYCPVVGAALLQAGFAGRAVRGRRRRAAACTQPFGVARGGLSAGAVAFIGAGLVGIAPPSLRGCPCSASRRRARSGCAPERAGRRPPAAHARRRCEGRSRRLPARVRRRCRHRDRGWSTGYDGGGRGSCRAGRRRGIGSVDRSRARSRGRRVASAGIAVDPRGAVRVTAGP